MSESQFEEVATGQFRYEDGEMVLSDPDPPSDSKPEEGLSGSRKSRRKQTFERRNIKKVREDALSEEAKAAQKAEMERRKRLLAKDGPDQADFSNIEFLLNGDGSSAIEVSDIELEGNELPTKRPKLEDNESEESEALPFDIHLQPIKNEEPTKDDKTYDDSSHHSDVGSTDSLSFHTENEKTVTAVPTASAALFGSKYTSNWSSHAGRTREDAILLGDSDDDDKAPDSVIEVSDGEEEPDEVETEICELRDAANLADSSGRIILNPTRSKEDEPEIALAPQIARVIKPHQVSGVRFLYDNLVENMERFQNTEGFGCILAHSMGLGKTIQIIGFLETIFRCCNAQRVLVIVPINTIQNWQAEFELWLPSGSSSDKPSEIVSQKPGRGRPPANGRMDHSTESNKSPSSDSADNSHDYQPGGERPVTSSGHIKESDESDEDTQTNSQASEGSNPNKGSRAFKLFVVRDVVKTVSQRHQIICQWFKEGGVLLLGYEMFRLLLNQKRLGTNSTKAQMRAASKRKKKILCVDLEKEEKREQMLADFHTALLDPGPQLVICDEGHRIKNSEASISKALKAIRTRRRVVLTGYPLQNNLMEYWCMVDFVRPNYLGTKQEFTNMFQRPIENGQCIDSTPEDRKVMQGRAHVLHDLLSGFVQRRSHAVLKATLPPKTEVVLLIKLSSLQRTLYAAFMRSLNSSGPLGWVQVNTLKTYAMCCKIWNHPDILWRAMEEHKEAMDFDIDDPSAPSSCGTGSFSVKNLHKGSSSSSLSRRSSSQSAPGDCESSGGAADSSQSQVFGTQQFASNMSMNFWPSIQSNAFPPNFQFPQPNPFFPISNPSMPNVSYPIHSPSTPTFMYNQQTIQSSPGTYDWATDPSLWGPDYQPGNVEHSGKIMIFLTILEGCVQAGDKVLVFTQSLFTLDLLERILRRLPLPQVRGSDKRKPDNPCSSGSYDDDHSSSSVSKTEPRIPELSLDVGPKTEKCDTDTSTSENNNPQLRPEEPEGKCVISVIKKEVECNELTKSEEFDTKGLQLESSFNEEVKMQEAVNSLQTSRNQTSSTAKRDEEPKKEEADELPEENLRSLHYRLATRSNRSDIPTVWTKNVHYFRLDGSTTASEREKLINNFNNPNNPSKLFLVSTRAGSLGVNLIGANRVVVFDASWNPCHDCQAVCRVYRYGQHKPCYIYRLVSDNTMEKKIYDRQVTKQGMSDRVVDELNPSQQFTRSQVELLMSFEDKDMSTITDDDIEKCQELVQPDPVLGTILDKHKCWITKVPFTHESLLIDRKDYRLTRIEKRLARQRYEQEKRLSLSYQQAHLYQLQQMQLLQQQQLLASGINPCLLSSRTPNILSRNHMSYRPTYTSGMAALDAMRQVEKQSRIRMLQHDMDTARKRCGYDRPDAPDLASDCKITRIVASSDLYFPSTTASGTTQRKIPKGELLEVIQTSKGKYLRITRTGDLFVVKTTPSANTSVSKDSSGATEDSPVSTTAKSNTMQPASDAKASSGNASPQDGNLLGDSARIDSQQPASQIDLSSSGSDRLTPTPTDVTHASNSLSTPGVRLNFDSIASSKDSARNPSQSYTSDVSAFVRSKNDLSCEQQNFPHFPETLPQESDGSVFGHSSSPLHQPSSNKSQDAVQSKECTQTNGAHSSIPSILNQPSQCHFDPNGHSVNAAEQRQYQNPNQTRNDPWLCAQCGLPSGSGCLCSSGNTTQSVTQSPKKTSTVSISAPSSSSTPSSCSSSYADNATSSYGDFTFHSTGNESTPLSTGQFATPSNYDFSTAAHYYQNSANPRQHQYFRAAEEVARQSAAAAAYFSLNKQQVFGHLTGNATTTAPHQSAFHSDFAAPNRDSPVCTQQQQRQTRDQLSSAGSSSQPSGSSYADPSTQSSMSVVQDYFAHLAEQQQQQQPLSQQAQASSSSGAGKPYPVSAAMQQYFAADNVVVSTQTGAADHSPHPYVDPSFQSQSDESRRLYAQTSNRSSFSYPSIPSFPQPSDQMMSAYDRSQHPREVLPNFRFPES